MKQSLTYSAAIMLTLLSIGGIYAWPSFKAADSARFVGSEIQMAWSSPDGRLASPYHINISMTIQTWEVAVGLTILAGISFLLGMGCCWVFGSRSSN